MRRPTKIEKYIHYNIICRLTKDPAILAMGLIGGIKYNLGLAKEGRDFISVPLGNTTMDR